MATTPTTAMVAVNGYALRDIRVGRGIDIRLLADQIPCDRSYLAKIELGHHNRVSPSKFRAIVAALGCDYRSLLVNPYGEVPEEAAS